MNGKKILVADRDAYILRSLKLVLEEAGYSVVTATDGEDALHKTKEQKPDLVILDIEMYKINGYEIRGKLQTEAFPKDIPVVILSALSDSEQKLEDTEPRIFTVVAKPFSPYSIVDKVNEILRG